MLFSSRDAKRGASVVEKCKQMQNVTDAKHTFVACDAFSLKSIKECASQISNEHSRIDALVMSQGMATIQGFTPTVDGNDQKLTLHYFGRMAFVKSFLPGLRSAGPDARVISVLSGGVHSAYAEYSNDFELTDNYSIKNAADAAGFYTDLGLDALALKEVGVTFVTATSMTAMYCSGADKKTKL